MGAIDKEGELTELGEMMADFPLEPQLAKMAISSPQFNCVEDVLTIIALLSVPHCFLRPKGYYQEADACRMKFSNQHGDHITALNAFKAYAQNHYDDNYCHENYLNHRSFKNVIRIQK